MRLAFFGTPRFAEVSLRHLFEKGHEIRAVFTQPDKPKGRGKEMGISEVKKAAQELGIEIFQPRRMKDGAVAALLKEMQIDLAVVVAYGRLLPLDILTAPPLGCINLHGSLLPRLRGAAPIQWSIASGEKITGVTTMYMAEGLDSGDMILKAETPITGEMTAAELHDILAPLGAELLDETIKLIANGQAPRERQDESLVTWAPPFERKDARMNFSLTAQEVHDRARGFYPFPGAFFSLGGQIVKVHKTSIAEGAAGKPGELIKSDGLVIACKEGAVSIDRLQLPGGKAMDTKDYLRGHKFEADFVDEG